MAKVGKRLKKYKFLTLIVDDNSPDGTGRVIQKYMLRNRNIVLLKGKKQGLGVAMIRGYRYAMEKLKADIVVSNEADGAYDPNKIPFMIKKIEAGWDVVVASRHVAHGQTQGWTVSRKLNHWVANTFFATWIAGVYQVRDHNGAFRAIRVKGVLDNLDFSNFPIRGFGFFSYCLFRLTKVTDKFYEFPVTYKFRTRGESKVSFNPKYIKTYIKDILEYVFLSLKIRFES